MFTYVDKRYDKAHQIKNGKCVNENAAKGHTF